MYACVLDRKRHTGIWSRTDSTQGRQGHQPSGALDRVEGLRDPVYVSATGNWVEIPDVNRDRRLRFATLAGESRRRRRALSRGADRLGAWRIMSATTAGCHTDYARPRPISIRSDSRVSK